MQYVRENRPVLVFLPVLALGISGCQLKIRASLNDRAPASFASGAAQVVFTTQPTGVASGSVMPGGVVVELRDGSGARIVSGPDASASVTLSLASGDGIFTGTKTVSAVNGVADFSGANLNFQLGGTKSLVATKADTGSGSGVVTGTSSSFTVTVPTVSGFSVWSGVLNPNAHADGTSATGRVNGPRQMVYDGSTYIYFTDSSATIRRMTVATGDITTIAGSPYQRGNVDGQGSAALFDSPYGIAISGTTLFVSDDVATTIRMIDLTTSPATVTTVAGAPYKSGGHVNGTGATVRFYNLRGIAALGTKLYIADNSTSYIRSMDLSSPYTVADYAGNGTCGSTPGAITGAVICYPNSVSTDGTDLYVGDAQRLKKITVGTGMMSVLVDHSAAGGSDAPEQIAINGSDLYYEKVFAGIGTFNTGTLAESQVVGCDWCSGFVDGTGLGGASTARLGAPLPGMVYVGGFLYVSDYINGAIRKIDVSNGTTTTLYGTANPSRPKTVFDLYHSTTQFWFLGADSQYVYRDDAYDNFIDRIPVGTGVESSFLGSGSCAYTEGTGLSSAFCDQGAILSDGTDLYIVDGSNSVVRKANISSKATSLITGTPSTTGFADGGPAVSQFRDLYHMGFGRIGNTLYLTDNNRVRAIDIGTGATSSVAGNGSSSCNDGMGTGVASVGAGGSAVALGGYLYFVDTYCGVIKRFNPADDSVTAIAGTRNSGATNGVAADGAFGAATFGMPKSLSGWTYEIRGALTTDGTYLYFTDTYQGSVRQIDPSTGIVTTVWGVNRYNEAVPGAAANVRFAFPQGIVYSFGKFYISDDYGVWVSY